MRTGSTVIDHAAGVLLGQACGDALGVPYEFATPPSAGELAAMRGGGLGPYEPGEWSDDTQMALCIARVAAAGADLSGDDALDAIADAFLEWAGHGASDIGTQTRAVLSAARRGTGPVGRRLRDAARAYAAAHPCSAGNGALMRTSVVGSSALDDRNATAAAARAVAELTHGDPLAAESCVLWSEAVRVAVTEGRFELLAGLGLLPPARRGQWQGWIEAATGADPNRFNPNGFTVTALQAAWAAITATPEPPLDPSAGSYPCLHLQHALHAAVRVGNDTDTVAAIAGGLLGARWGGSAVPWHWRRAVHGWPGMAVRDLVSLGILTARRGTSDSQGWPMGEQVESFDYDYTERPAVRHPYDDGIWLGTVAASEHDADGGRRQAGGAGRSWVRADLGRRQEGPARATGLMRRSDFHQSAPINAVCGLQDGTAAASALVPWVDGNQPAPQSRGCRRAARGRGRQRPPAARTAPRSSRPIPRADHDVRA